MATPRRVRDQLVLTSVLMAGALVACAPAGNVGVPTDLPSSTEALPANTEAPTFLGGTSSLPEFDWVDTTHFRMVILNDRVPCASEPTVVADSPTTLTIHFAITDPRAMCNLALYAVAYEFELPEGATGRPLQISVTAEGLTHVSRGELR